MLDDKIFELEPQEVMALVVDDYSNEDIFNLSYYIWSFFPECTELMNWRETTLLPKLTAVLGEFDTDSGNDLDDLLKVVP